MIGYIHGLRKIKKLMNHKPDLGKVTVQLIEQEQEQELYLPRHRLVEVEVIISLTLQTYLIISAVGQF